jgi:alpha-D-xyloside xylohydrolase
MVWEGERERGRWGARGDPPFLAPPHSLPPFSPVGIWLDMNEVSNYCTGDVCKATRKIPPNNKFVCELSCEAGPNALGKKTNPPLPAGLYNPPYAINNGEDETPLGTKTLPVTARHHGGVLEYDAHNLYGQREERERGRE